MEGSCEEDTLSGQAGPRISPSPPELPAHQRWLKIALLVLLACAVLLVVAAAARQQTLRDCQLNAQQQLDARPAQPPQLQALPTQPPPLTPQPPPQQPTVAAPTPHKQPTSQIKINNDATSTQNLWLLSREQKIALFRKADDPQPEASSSFLKDKDAETAAFFAEYENRSSVVEWWKKELTGAESVRLQETVKTQLQERRKFLEGMIVKYAAKYKDKSGYMPDENKGITYQQFMDVLNRKKLTGSRIFPQEDPELQLIAAQEQQYFEEKYKVSQYEELPVCIVVPTYNNNNKPGLRYLWAAESLLQQNYSNFRAVIIDDASKDQTAVATAQYLKWRGADPGRFVVVAGRERRTALENIYYGLHKYCDYGQIFVVFDGDDELIGRQALRVLNALYQQHRYYLVYSQFISYNPNNRKEQLEIGLSEDFPYFVKDRNNYRRFKHSYSQLRSVLSDLLLLEPMSSLKLQTGKFFTLLEDNALFYPAFEMSCRNYLYLPEVFYWYNINTGSNEWKQAKTALYRENHLAIINQKPFTCIHDRIQHTTPPP